MLIHSGAFITNDVIKGIRYLVLWQIFYKLLVSVAQVVCDVSCHKVLLEFIFPVACVGLQIQQPYVIFMPFQGKLRF